MLELLEKIVSTLIAAAPVGGVVPSTSIFTGPVDLVFETQGELLYPMITIHVVSEVQRSNPLNTRDTQIQIDILSRNSQLELENVYEGLISALSYLSGNQSTAHIFWSRLGGAVDDYEADRRIWHRACSFVFWSIK